MRRVYDTLWLMLQQRDRIILRSMLKHKSDSIKMVYIHLDVFNEPRINAQYYNSYMKNIDATLDYPVVKAQMHSSDIKLLVHIAIEHKFMLSNTASMWKIAVFLLQTQMVIL